MGKYINETSKGRTGNSFDEICAALKADGALTIPEPYHFYKEELVCVVDNPDRGFAAAAYAETLKEMKRFQKEYDGRRHQWYLYTKAPQYAR